MDVTKEGVWVTKAPAYSHQILWHNSISIVYQNSFYLIPLMSSLDEVILVNYRSLLTVVLLSVYSIDLVGRCKEYGPTIIGLMVDNLNASELGNSM
jgi:hypothetical protein